jgi:simple sugar transport system permease protein
MTIEWFALLLAAAVPLAAPLLFAALGEVISETAGVINIELEGMMLVGAFTGVAGALMSGDLIVAFTAALVGGVLVATLQGVACFIFGANQVVAGIVLNILALGATTFLLVSALGADVTRAVVTLTPLPIPLLSDIPLIGKALFAQNIVVYLAYLAVPVVWYLIAKTRFGLTLKSVGEKPAAAEAMGVDVVRTRWIALLLCGALAGIGGGLLTLGGLGVFTPNITKGIGFIALAAVIFGRWKPVGAFGAVMLFSLVDAFQIRAQALGLPVPYQLLVALPYVVTLLALALFVSKMRPPAALAINFEK